MATQINNDGPSITGRTIPLDGMMFGYTLREPIGVVGAVIPCALHMNAFASGLTRKSVQ